MGERHHVLLGVSGSVAAIKLPELVAALQAHGDVRVVLTSAGKRLARTQCDPAACAEHVYDDETEWTAWQKVGDQVLHIALREWADVLVIAPLSANTMAKLAHGLADSLLAAIARVSLSSMLAVPRGDMIACMQAWDFDKPMVLCPAMNTCMWEHPVTAQQVRVPCVPSSPDCHAGAMWSRSTAHNSVRKSTRQST